MSFKSISIVGVCQAASAIAAMFLAGCSKSSPVSDGPKWSLGTQSGAAENESAGPVLIEARRPAAASYAREALPPPNASQNPNSYNAAPIGVRAPMQSPTARPALVQNAITVAAGDTLSSLSRRHGVTVSDLMIANNLADATIRPGQRLALPQKKASW